MRDAIIGLIEECENENGSINDTDLFDKRLIETRKWFNNGVDPFEHKYYDFDFKSAQFMLDQGIDKERIAKELGVNPTNVNTLIRMGCLNGDNWLLARSNSVNKTSKYNLVRNSRYLAKGTISELAKFMKVPIWKVRYWNSERYRNRTHKITYKLLEVSNV